MTDSTRALMPDYLRLISLFGIVVVNVQFIGFSLLSGLDTITWYSTAELITLWLVDGLALYKSYSLFSFMFGVGLGFLMVSAARTNVSIGKLYRNRMIGLFLFGVVHGCLFFPGDVLLVYAIMGAILFRLRNWEAARLVKVGTALVAVQALTFASFAASPSEMPETIVALERDVMTGDSFVAVIWFRAVAFAVLSPFLVLFQGIAALGWFCLGLAAVKSGMIDQADHPLWARARWWCLGPGIALSLLGSWMLHAQGVLGASALILMAAPISTLGYLGAIAAISRPPGPVMQHILAAGGSSLSIYLGQSIILSTLFSGYGFGLWDAVSRPVVVLIGVGVTVVLIAALSIWRGAFRLGPFEWLLRRITYAGQVKSPPA